MKLLERAKARRQKGQQFFHALFYGLLPENASHMSDRSFLLKSSDQGSPSQECPAACVLAGSRASQATTEISYRISKMAPLCKPARDLRLITRYSPGVKSVSWLQHDGSVSWVLDLRGSVGSGVWNFPWCLSKGTKRESDFISISPPGSNGGVPGSQVQKAFGEWLGTSLVVLHV